MMKPPPPAIKIGPLKIKRSIKPTSTVQLSQVAGPSNLASPSPPLSPPQRPVIPSTKPSPTKKIRKTKDEIEKGTDRPVTRSSSRKPPGEDEEIESVQKVSKLIKGWLRLKTELSQVDRVRKRKLGDEQEPLAKGSKKIKSTSSK